MAHDLVASFYGGYDQVGLSRPPRYHVPRIALLIAVVLLVLVVFVVADVAALESLPANVEVTSVSWVSEGSTLVTQSGFSVHGGQHVTLSLTCDTICIRFGAATVNAPFTLVAFSVVYHPDQYTNVTVLTPSYAYSGPLTITISVAPAEPTGEAT